MVKKIQSTISVYRFRDKVAFQMGDGTPTKYLDPIQARDFVNAIAKVAADCVTYKFPDSKIGTIRQVNP